MDFKTNRPIYLQIVDLCHERIISGSWSEGERVPSVRELGVELAVNAHTVLKAYDMLQTEGVIEQKRGLGFFLAFDARDRVGQARRKEFLSDTLPSIFSQMHTFSVSIEEVVQEYMKFIDKKP